MNPDEVTMYTLQCTFPEGVWLMVSDHPKRLEGKCLEHLFLTESQADELEAWFEINQIDYILFSLPMPTKGF